jgi:hypothetical protein
MTCRTCQHYAVNPDSDGKVRMRKNSVSRCAAPVPRTAFLLPDSVTKSYGYWEPSEKDRRFMSPDDGEGCPTHTQRAKR